MKRKNWINFIVKLSLAVVIFVIIHLANVWNMVSPEIANEVAMEQMKATSGSYIPLQMYTQISNTEFGLLLLLLLMVFARDIIRLLRRDENEEY